MTIDGIEVIDATSDFPLVVEETEAQSGKALDIEKCPAALACLAKMPAIERVQVYKSRLLALKKVWVGDTGVAHSSGFELRWERYIVPKSLMIQEAIIDNGGKFQPGTYVLKAPPASKRTGKQQGSNTRPPKGKEPKRVYHKTPMRINAPTSST